MTKTYKCGCGEWAGEQCAWSGKADEMIVVEFMPEHLRASHTAAGHRGYYPHNGAIRIAVERSCAEYIVANDDEWASIVEGASPEKYAAEQG